MTKIKILKNACAIISDDSGGIKVVDEDDVPIKSKSTNNSVVAICRCGRSLNMPFCDGSHAREIREIESNLTEKT